MAGVSLLMLLDDIASLLDDVSLMTKMAARKAASVLGDDLALNAEQVSGVRADRELPVVWAVAKGSMLNKVILVPSALAISAFIPWAIVPLLMLGGIYLCYEGAEKLVHSYLHKKALSTSSASAVQSEPLASTERLVAAPSLAVSHSSKAPHSPEVRHPDAKLDPNMDVQTYELGKIKGAIRTDFVLSAEIIVITLGIVSDAPFMQQVMVLAGIALGMTISVYGLVAGIVKLDDLGLYLTKKGGAWEKPGLAILAACPYLMRGLSIVGTIAMFLVGGGILVHGLAWLEHWVAAAAALTHGLPAIGNVLAWLTPLLLHMVIGLAAGLLVVGLFKVKELFMPSAQ
ncbi:hypothetical protein CBP31_11790 [Oceanisphaera profunda]|uniref:DUF808 domain-containing protein n=1 Tax=Oceanisphaera profunda TaxID=1416627 RepID=A0A1Y0D6P4_9GAMM|nr:DUF808 domain-containing protein [Oceanisphaera profunda]ART83211.1 hypothetical protein CBP31_11790 [Oceanisphaera profunda]